MHHLNEVTDKLADKINIEEQVNVLDNGNKNIRNMKQQRICCTSLTEGITNVRPIGWMVTNNI